MKNVNTILAIVDPTTAAHPAVDKAAILASRFQARLELFVCDVEGAESGALGAEWAGAKHSRAVLNSQRKSMLEQLAEPLRTTGLDVLTSCAWANPLHAGLLQKISDCKPDLVVKDTHPHGLLQRTLITNTDWQLLRCSRAALLLVKPEPWKDQPQVLASLDPGHHADRPEALNEEILGWADTLSVRLQGQLHALHVHFPTTYATKAITQGTLASTSEFVPEMLEAEKRTQLAVLATLAKPYHIDANHLHVALGSPIECLPAEVERLHIDVTTMGVVSRSGLKRIFIGNTAEQVLDRLPCDVLAIKPIDFSDLPF